MDFNPYTPPKANVENQTPVAKRADAAAAGPVAPLSPELEMRAMAELGKRRASVRNRTLAITLPSSAIVLMVIGLGFIPAMIVGSALGGVLTKVYMKRRNRSLANDVCRALGINPLAFNPERYLID